VLVKLDDKSGEMVKSKGGIYLPDSVKESPVMLGTVVGVGQGAYGDGGVFLTPTAQVGDKVLFGSYAGANIDEPMGFENYMIVRDTDILAIIISQEETYEEKVSEKMSSGPHGPDYGLNEKVHSHIPYDPDADKKDQAGEEIDT